MEKSSLDKSNIMLLDTRYKMKIHCIHILYCGGSQWCEPSHKLNNGLYFGYIWFYDEWKKYFIAPLEEKEKFHTFKVNKSYKHNWNIGMDFHLTSITQWKLKPISTPIDLNTIDERSRHCEFVMEMLCYIMEYFHSFGELTYIFNLLCYCIRVFT